MRPPAIRRPQRFCRSLWRLALGVGLLSLSAYPTNGQTLNPVYVDDSPAASETFLRVQDHLNSSNLSEAVRALQALLDEHADRVVLRPGNPDPAERDLFVGVRSEVQRVLLQNPELLARYRQMQETLAQTALARNDAEKVETSYLLTTSGFDAALCLANRQLESASFQAAFITLQQLESHPDCNGDRAKAAGKVASLLNRYFDSPALLELVKRWNAGVTPAPTKVEWPVVARRVGVSPLDPLSEANLSQVLGKPLRSTPIATEEGGISFDAAGPERDRVPMLAKRLAVMPTVADDTLYLNDGSSISAWDRITLTKRWRAEPTPLGADREDDNRNMPTFGNTVIRQNRRNALEELLSVAAAGRDVVAVTGLPVSGYRIGDPRIHGIDAGTGQVRWSVNLDQLDAQLSGLSVRGPGIITEGTVVFAARRAEPDRRQVTVYLVGLDVADGRLRWHRLMGSTGALPYRQDAYISDASVLRDGIIYRGDMLGVIGAYEAATGRPRWLRRIPAGTQPNFDTLAPWHMNAPVLWRDQLIALSPDRTEIYRLNRSTGELISKCKADRFGTAAAGGIRYLLAAGESLVGVAAERLAVAPLDSFETAPVILSQSVPDAGVRGRVTVAGRSLLVPVVDGLVVVDSDAPAAAPARIPLDSPGNFIALESQLIVVDDAYVHSYLLWEVAERILTERMKAETSDASAAVTLAELAYRAGKHDRIVPAADAALASIDAAKTTETSLAARARLFDSLHTMVALSLDPGGEPKAPLGANPSPSTPAAPDPDRPPGSDAPRIGDTALLKDILARMDRAATSLDQRVAYLLAAGRLDEKKGLFAQAAASYQSILDDPKLSAATWAGPRLSTRGELEVTRRLERLVRAHGAAVYAAFDSKAQQELDSLGASPEPDALLSLATRFPVAATTPAVWERLAETYLAQGRPQAVIGALESGLEAAERLPASPAIARLAGRLLTELESRDQLSAASALLRALTEKYPGLTLTVGGKEMPAGELAASVSQRIAATHRWPNVGPVKAEGVQVLQGWTIVEPIIKDRIGLVPGCLVLKSADQFALWMPKENEGGGAVGPGVEPAHGEFDVVWKKQIESTSTIELLKLDRDSAYVFAVTDNGASIEKISLNPARSRWQTELFSLDPPGAALPVKQPRGQPQEKMPTPQDGLSVASDIVSVTDDRTFVFAERTGRICGIDAQNGEALWTVRSPLDRVYDAALSSGVLVLAGDQEMLGPGGHAMDFRPEIVVLDARTGQETQRLPQKWGQVRWIRIADSGDLIAGCEQAIVSTDLERVQTNWVLSDHHVSKSRDAWIFGDSLFLLDHERELWLISASSGELSKQALEAPRAHLGGPRPIQAFALRPATPPVPPAPGVPGAVQTPPPAATTSKSPITLAAFSTYQGVVIYSLDGVLQGIDGIGGFDGLLPPVPAHSNLITITTMPDGRRGDGELIYTFHYLDTTTAMVRDSIPILLGSPPRSMMLMDNKLILTAGGTSLILNAPASK